MKMVPYDYNKLGGVGAYKRTKNQDIVEEFLNSGNTCVEIVGYTNKSAYSCQNSIDNYIHRNRMQNTVSALCRKGHVYLVRLDKIED